MATGRQIAAYREIKAKRLEESQIRAYGMVPIPARHPGKCGCGHVTKAENMPGWYGSHMKDTACAFRPGDKIVKWRGAWWSVSCVERVQQEEFRATCKYVLEEKTRKGWWAKGWTNDPQEAATWRKVAAEMTELDPELAERVVER